MPPEPNMPDNIYEALRESHALQRAFFRRLLRAQAQAEVRRPLLAALKAELAAHAAAEERFLYAPILMDDLGLSPSRHAMAEHHEIDELMETLEALDPEGEAWLVQARKLSKEVHHHLKEEETRFFQVSGKVLSEAQKSTLATRYRRDYQRMKAKLGA